VAAAEEAEKEETGAGYRRRRARVSEGAASNLTKEGSSPES